jgi:hypothetical protein
MSFHALSSRLLLWRDGVPSSYQPLLPLQPFGGLGIGFSALAADVSMLCGLPVHRTTLLVALAAQGLVQIALFAVLARRMPPAAAALASVLALAMAPLPQAWLSEGADPAVLALAFALAAAALHGRPGRSPAVAAGLLWAAALATDAPVAVAAALVGAVIALPTLRRAGAAVAITAAVALILASPALARLASVLAASDIVSVPLVGPDHVLMMLSVAIVTGAALVPTAATGRLRTILLCALGVASVAAAGRHLAAASRAVAITADDLRGMEAIALRTPLLETVCGAPGPVQEWLPAVAGRAASHPYVPEFLERMAPVTTFHKALTQPCRTLGPL